MGKSILLRRFYYLLMVFCVIWGCFGYSYARSWKEAKAKVEGLIELGEYNFVAQFEGPQLIKDFPKQAHAHYLYSYSLYLTGDFSKAKSKLSEALSLVNSIPADYLWLNGLLETSSYNFDKAISLLEKAYKLRPSYIIAMDMGHVAWQKGDYQKAIKAYQLAKRFPEGNKKPWPYINQAKLFSYQGNYLEVTKVLQNFLNLQENREKLPLVYEEVFYLLGQAYQELGDVESARANYEATLAINPKHSLTLRALIQLANDINQNER